MSIPDFTAEGLLPPGVHECTLEEVGERFGKARVNFQRPELFAKLKDYIREVKHVSFVTSVIIDGSFVTNVDTPNDIDIVVVVSEDYNPGSILRPFQYNVISKRYTRKQFGFDIVITPENSAEYHEAVSFFQQTRERRNQQKGVLRIEL